MNGGYALEWLDRLITVSLNPPKSGVDAIQILDVVQLKIELEAEKDKIQAYLKQVVFSLRNKKKIQFLINQHYSDLSFLLDRALENHAECPDRVGGFNQLCTNIVSCLNELLAFTENRFSSYLSLNQRVPSTSLSKAKKDLLQKIDKLRIEWEGQIFGPDDHLGDTLMQILYSLLTNPKKSSFSFREIFYLKELCNNLQDFKLSRNESDIYAPLDKLLIYLNFNDRDYINNFIQRLGDKLNSYENVSDKIEILQYYFKSFTQIRQKPGSSFDISHESLTIEISNWFNQEIFYLEKILDYAAVPAIETSLKYMNNPRAEQKLLCNLSVDQIAIILRSLDDLRILVARSLSAVFKGIVPYLSTPARQNISFDSMRSKSYAMEERDKEVVIKTLEEMIKKIKEY